MASKYDALADELTRTDGQQVTFRFQDIDRLVGGLPPSGRKYRPWWANSTGQPWLRAGWKVSSVNLTAEQVRFRRLR